MFICSLGYRKYPTLRSLVTRSLSRSILVGLVLLAPGPSSVLSLLPVTRSLREPFTTSLTTMGASRYLVWQWPRPSLILGHSLMSSRPRWMGSEPISRKTRLGRSGVLLTVTRLVMVESP